MGTTHCFQTPINRSFYLFFFTCFYLFIFMLTSESDFYWIDKMLDGEVEDESLKLIKISYEINLVIFYLMNLYSCFDLIRFLI